MRMMMRESGATRPRTCRRLSVGAVGLVAMMAFGAVQGGAQRARRDTVVRTFRLHLRGGETTFVKVIGASRDDLVLMLDSLQRRFEDMDAESPERPIVGRHIDAMIRALSHLGRAGERARVSAEMNAQIQAEIGRSLARPTQQVIYRMKADAMPKGWIGINVEGPQALELRGDSAYIRYFSYPQVVSVEPSSPAEKVGITRGDRLVAYNGADVRTKSVNVTRLLRPDNRVIVTVERDGSPRDFSLLVGKAPLRLVERWQSGGAGSGEPARLDVFHRGAIAGALPAAGEMIVHFDRMRENAAVAGAMLAAISSPTFERYFGVSSGILVTSVFGDPAAASGLREGDVILRADGRELESVQQLRRLVDSRAADRSVDLAVIRHHKPVTVKLKW